MNVFIYEMKQNRKSIISWSVTFVLFAFVLMSATPLFIDESAGMKEVLMAFPDAVKDAMGIDIETFFSAVGFYSYIFIYAGLIAGIQAMSYGLGIISKENRMMTADFLMSKPKTRTSIYVQKLLAAVCGLAITEAAFYIAATVSILWQSGGDFAVAPFVLLSLTFTIYQMIFLAVGLFAATVVTRIKSTLSVTMGITFGTFLIGMISSITDSVPLRYLSPLKYFDSNYIMVNKAYETNYLVLSIVLTVVFTVASYVIYVKKDIKTLT